MINWMLEVEDVEDIACTVDDIEAMDRLQSFGLEGMEWKGECPRWRRREAVVRHVEGQLVIITALFGPVPLSKRRENPTTVNYSRRACFHIRLSRLG